MSRIRILLLLSGAALLGAADLSHAASIATVPVGDPGNAGELTGTGAGGIGPDATVGAVAYDYQIGRTEVTNAQYVEFLNAVADDDPNGLYNPSMATDTRAGIVRSGASGSYSYAVKPNFAGYTYADKPVVFVSCYDALRFANWLHNAQPNGPQDAATTEDGAYSFSGPTTVGPRNTQATWALANESEWYKAAFYDPDTASYYDYPTSSNTEPDNNLPSLDSGDSSNHFDEGYTTGNASFPLTAAGAYPTTQSPYGTKDQSGNVSEWTETAVPLGQQSYRVLRGGNWVTHFGLHANYRGMDLPTGEYNHTGFRVVEVPEPGALVLVLGGLSSLAFRRRRKRAVDTTAGKI
jgi:formylglycine-generating enzyme required for sulfatase activity